MVHADDGLPLCIVTVPYLEHPDEPEYPDECRRGQVAGNKEVHVGGEYRHEIYQREEAALINSASALEPPSLDSSRRHQCTVSSGMVTRIAAIPVTTDANSTRTAIADLRD